MHQSFILMGKSVQDDVVAVSPSTSSPCPAKSSKGVISSLVIIS
ncbi:unnamed protein product [Musa hybrid cultivar]